MGNIGFSDVFRGIEMKHGVKWVKFSCFCLFTSQTQKERVQSLEKSYASAKTQYSVSLRNLELISEDIHKKRNEAVNPVNAGTPIRPREECYGAEMQKEDDQPQSRRRSLSRKVSEERIKQAIAQKKYARGRFRSSLVSELDIDFDLDDSLDYGDEHTRSPGAKSVDIGFLKLNYYDDYQVLDVAPFMEREKALRNQSKTSSNVKRQDTPRPGSQIETTVRTSSFRSNNSLTSVEEANLPEVCENNEKHLESESDSRSSKVSLTRKHSRLKFSKQFPKIEEDKSSEDLTKDNGKQNETRSYNNESDEIVKIDQEHKNRTQSVTSVKSEVSVFAGNGIPERDGKISFDKDIDDTFGNVEELETSASLIQNLVLNASKLYHVSVPSLSTTSIDSAKLSDRSSVGSVEVPVRKNGIERTISVEDTEKVEGE